MSITRQSPHIFSRCAAAPWKAGWPPSLAIMPSMARSVPKGLPQRTHANGSTSCSTRGAARALPPSASHSRGCRVMADSGQVVAHRPHCTQFFSMKRSCGFSGLSASAPAGQAPTQLKHRVQAEVSTCRLPKGAPAAGSAMVSAGTGAWASRWSSARSSVPRLSAWAAKLAGRATVCAGAVRSAASSVGRSRASRASISRRCSPA